MEAENKNSVGLKARTFAFLGSAMFLLIAPGRLQGTFHGELAAARSCIVLWIRDSLRRSMVLAAAGLALLLESFLQFALKGYRHPRACFSAKTPGC